MATPTPPTQSAAAAGGTANPTSSADAALNAAQLVALEAKRRQDKAALLRSKVPRTLKRPRYNPRASRGIGMRRLRTNRFDVVNLAGTLLQDGHMAHMLLVFYRQPLTIVQELHQLRLIVVYYQLNVLETMKTMDT